MNSSLEISGRNVITNPLSSGAPYTPNTPSLISLGANIIFDRQGNLWTTYNNMVVAFKPPFKIGINSFPSLEIGQPNFTSNAWSGGPNGFSAPGDGGFDAQGNLWVPDTGNNRALEFLANPFASQDASTSGQALPGFVQFEFIAIGTATLIVATALSVTFLRRRGAGRRGLI